MKQGLSCQPDSLGEGGLCLHEAHLNKKEIRGEWGRKQKKKQKYVQRGTAYRVNVVSIKNKENLQLAQTKKKKK